MEAHSLSAICKRENSQKNCAVVTTVIGREYTSRALKMTYNLIVSCPRIEWYILLASARGTRIDTETINRRARSMSAFWDGGSGGADDEKILRKRRDEARTKRIGRIVNVYKNESRQRAKPKRMI
jgi:hypothetical protein